ncbi:hypothetical protein DFQ28_003789 [Apophysomyces sp. BC1034]|nr:hypothetical protein DFQ28_003789 [Apophysomyces sp. BC1034]
MKDKNGTGRRDRGSRRACRNAKARSVPSACHRRESVDDRSGVASRGDVSDDVDNGPPGSERRTDTAAQGCAGDGCAARGPPDRSPRAWRAASRTARSTRPSICACSIRSSAPDAALGNRVRSTLPDSLISTSQPTSSMRRVRNASRTSRLTRLRVTARGACFLPTTTPSLAGCPLARPYKTKCAERAHGRKRKTDENSSVFSSLAARGKLAGVVRTRSSSSSGERAPRATRHHHAGSGHIQPINMRKPRCAASDHRHPASRPP